MLARTLANRRYTRDLPLDIRILAVVGLVAEEVPMKSSILLLGAQALRLSAWGGEGDLPGATSRPLDFQLEAHRSQRKGARHGRAILRLS